MAETTRVVLGTFALVFCVSSALGGIESDSPLQVRHGAPLKIRCSSTNKPTLAKLEWIFTDVNNKSKIIGKHGNPRVIQVSDKVLELEITNVSSKHTGLYACRDRSVSRNGQTEMSLYVVATESALDRVTCNRGMFQCDELCIAKRFRCDREVDCPRGQDELDCPTECDPDTEFQCESGQCIDASYVCDHFHSPNCRDGTDEKHCPDRLYVYTGQIQPPGTGDPPHVLAYESRNWQVHGIYSVVAGVIGLVCVVTIIVITICRIHMRRDAQLAFVASREHHAQHPRTRTMSSRSGDFARPGPHDFALYMHPPLPPPPPPPSLLTATELTGLVVGPPPYSELQAQKDNPPPPYDEAVAPENDSHTHTHSPSSPIASGSCSVPPIDSSAHPLSSSHELLDPLTNSPSPLAGGCWEPADQAEEQRVALLQAPSNSGCGGLDPLNRPQQGSSSSDIEPQTT